MIYSIFGKYVMKGPHFAVVESAGLGLKIFTNGRTLAKITDVGSAVKFFTHLHVREDALDLFGFTSAEELAFFELLISVSGVGPKSALAIMDVAELTSLLAAIKEGRPDLLTKASGVGTKTAERIIIDLRNKVRSEKSELVVGKMDTDADLVETLVGLGYRREQAKAALGKVDDKITNLEERLKAALKVLSGKP
jgi:Holliday junction DNA helicase RuvA